MRAASLLAAAWLSLLLAGCGEQKLAADELITASRSVTVDVGRALALPPPGSFPVEGVTQRNYDNAISQVVSLRTRGRTPGENAIYVAFLTAADQPDSFAVEGNLMKEPAVDDQSLAQEMEDRLPGVAMAPSAVFVQNKYGPFGYAFGRSVGGEACLYAWQRLAPGDSVFRPRSGVISVRLRFCDPAGTEASLLRLAYDYSFNGSLRRSGWNPIGDAPAPSPDLGRAGAPIYPPQTGLPETWETAPAVPQQPARRRSAAPIRSPVAEPIIDKPLEGYPTVPPPPAP